MDNVQQRALLANICANLRDDVARLVYADFLEENDEEEYAAYIRKSIAASKAKRRGPPFHSLSLSVQQRVLGSKWDYGLSISHFPNPTHDAQTSGAFMDRGFVDELNVTVDHWLRLASTTDALGLAVSHVRFVPPLPFTATTTVIVIEDPVCAKPRLKFGTPGFLGQLRVYTPPDFTITAPEVTTVVRDGIAAKWPDVFFCWVEGAVYFTTYYNAPYPTAGLIVHTQHD